MNKDTWKLLTAQAVEKRIEQHDGLAHATSSADLSPQTLDRLRQPRCRIRIRRRVPPLPGHYLTSELFCGIMA